MKSYQLFLSIVVVLRNSEKEVGRVINELTDQVKEMVADYELVVVDNASTDGTVAALRHLIDDEDVPNLQVFGLTKEVDQDIACWAGIENSLGDFVVAYDPLVDDGLFLPQMLEPAVSGSDVVFAFNENSRPAGIIGGSTYRVLSYFYKLATDIDLSKEAPRYRVLSRRVVNFILQHADPCGLYRHLPATGGFSRSNLVYSSSSPRPITRNLFDTLDRGSKLLISTTRIPMRMVTSLSLFGAFANVVYSVYVLFIGLLKADVAPGWVSLSLQQSGMFFLLSLVLMVLGEYVLQMASLSNEGPKYHIGTEFISKKIMHREKLNLAESGG